MSNRLDRTCVAVLACVLATTVSVAPTAGAKGQEVGTVCTGTQMNAGTCDPAPLQSTPIGVVPSGCKPNSHDTIACGRRGSHMGGG